MKKHFIRLCLLATVLAMAAGTLDAQTTKPRPKKKRTATAKSKTNVNKNAAASAAVAPAKDTTKPVAVLEADIKLDTPRRSLRNDAIIERNLVKDRTPLAYEYIREDDAVYRERVWRELDVHEKMNLPFVYKATEDNGNQRFIYILLNAIKNGQITAFDANVDDRFTTPMTFKQIAEGLVNRPKVVQVPDMNLDPDGSKGLMRDTLIQDEFNPELIEKYMVKEEWVINKESSTLQVRILGIAPEKNVLNPDGTLRDVTPIFWVYYPELRPLLSKYEAYNGKNFGARMSWEELFESRMSPAVSSNPPLITPAINTLPAYIKDPILRLLEGENIKEKIFNYEQDLWSY